jgi:hypothetical protein
VAAPRSARYIYLATNQNFLCDNPDVLCDLTKEAARLPMEVGRAEISTMDTVTSDFGQRPHIETVVVIWKKSQITFGGANSCFGHVTDFG